MPIDQVLRNLALRIDTSVDPETQPLLEYSFLEDNTQRILARIRGTPQPDGGGQLAFETNAGAGTTTPRMVIDHRVTSALVPKGRSPDWMSPGT